VSTIVPQILSSKKFIAAAIAAIISFFAVREGMTMEQIVLITGPLYGYIGAQGLADIGKERAKAERAASPSNAQPPTSTPGG